MLFYIVHNLLPSMLLFTVGFGMVCLAALVLYFACQGCRKITVRSSRAQDGRGSAQAPPQENRIYPQASSSYAESVRLGHDGGAPYAAQ